jgi:hypothetical protein
MASRIVAKSTIAGTPVKSCMITLAGVYGISILGSVFSFQLATAFMWSLVTFIPSSVLKRFSRSIFKLKGRDLDPETLLISNI